MKRGQLKVWWIPQVGMEKTFEVEVATVQEGVKLMDVLADYDQFQLDNRIKPDYANVGGIVMWDDESWVDWYDEDTGEDDPRAYVEAADKIDDPVIVEREDLVAILKRADKGSDPTLVRRLMKVAGTEPA
jgi:phosphodiesterase/alkaline phosphatase D-like protein